MALADIGLLNLDTLMPAAYTVAPGSKPPARINVSCQVFSPSYCSAWRQELLANGARSVGAAAQMTLCCRITRNFGIAAGVQDSDMVDEAILPGKRRCSDSGENKMTHSTFTPAPQDSHTRFSKGSDEL